MKYQSVLVVCGILGACAPSGVPVESLPTLTTGQENQLLDQMGVVQRGDGIVFVHGCQSRSAGLTFARKDVVAVAQQYRNASLSRKLKAICAFSK